MKRLLIVFSVIQYIFYSLPPLLHCKKVVVFLVPSRDVTNHTLPVRELLNYSRPGRFWLVTSRLGTGKTINFFTVCSCPPPIQGCLFSSLAQEPPAPEKRDLNASGRQKKSANRLLHARQRPLREARLACAVCRPLKILSAGPPSGH
jgi:hypothetical protein